MHVTPTVETWVKCVWAGYFVLKKVRAKLLYSGLWRSYNISGFISRTEVIASIFSLRDPNARSVIMYNFGGFTIVIPQFHSWWCYLPNRSCRDSKWSWQKQDPWLSPKKQNKIQDLIWVFFLKLYILTPPSGRKEGDLHLVVLHVLLLPLFTLYLNSGTIVFIRNLFFFFWDTIKTRKKVL